MLADIFIFLASIVGSAPQPASHNDGYAPLKNVTHLTNRTVFPLPTEINVSNSTRLLEKEIKLLRDRVTSLESQITHSICRIVPTSDCGPCECIYESRLPQKHYCDCRKLGIRNDCLAFRLQGVKTDGVYLVRPYTDQVIEVFCDQTTQDGGWTVFQRRMNGLQNFRQDWETYKVGFGDLQHEHWLGNDNINAMLAATYHYKGSELRVDLTSWRSEKSYAHYSNFEVGDEFAKYELHVGNYSSSSTAGDALTTHIKMDFTALDRDNDIWTAGNCAQPYAGGWWYANTNCVGKAFLNGLYFKPGESMPAWKGIVWSTWKGASDSLKKTEMKFRRKQ